MANQPIFPNAPKVSWGTVSAANTAKDGTGSVVTVFTAGTSGSRIDKISVRALGANAATVLRLFVNNGQPSSSPTNNSLAYESTIATTSATETTAQVDNILDVNRGTYSEAAISYLPAGYKINVSLGTAIAAGLQVTVYGGDF